MVDVPARVSNARPGNTDNSLGVVADTGGAGTGGAGTGGAVVGGVVGGVAEGGAVQTGVSDIDGPLDALVPTLLVAVTVNV